MKFKILTKKQKEENANLIGSLTKKYGFRFHNPNYEKVPHTSYLFDGEKERRALSKLENYLINSAVIDMGTNSHQKMSNLRYKFSHKEYEWHREYNKLGVNLWWSIAGLEIDRVKNLLKRTDLLIPKKLENEFKNYRNFPFQEKVNFCKKIDKSIYQILETVYKDYS